MTEEQPLVIFSTMKGFPNLVDDNKVLTYDFLQAASEMVKQIEKFGKLFFPVVYDMNRNVEKLLKVYHENISEHKYLEDMILKDLQKKSSICPDSLLWLKRALELLAEFFKNILNDKTCDENLKNHLRDAYKKTLRPYHNWITQEASALIYKFIPYRSQLVGKDTVNDSNMKSLELFINTMNMNLNQINTFYSIHNLNNTNKA